MRREQLVIDDTGSVEGIYDLIYILNQVEIWTGVTDALLTYSLTDFER